MNKLNPNDHVEICFLPEGQEASPYMLKIGDRGTVLHINDDGTDYLEDENNVLKYIVQFNSFEHPHSVPENWLKVSVQ